MIYTGKYQVDQQQSFTIAIQDGELIYFPKGGSKSRLIYQKEDWFSIDGSVDLIQFRKEDKMTLHTLNQQKTMFKIDQLEMIQTVGLSVEELKEYEGQYDVSGQFVLEIIVEGQKIYGQVGPDRHEILYVSTDQFLAKSIDAKLTFVRNESDEITGLILKQGNQREAQKID